MPEYPKKVAEYIWEVEPGAFCYSDETERFSYIEYHTIEEAQAALALYVIYLNQEKP